MKLELSMENALVVGFVLVLLYLFYDIQMIKEEKYTDFSADYHMSHAKKDFIKKKKMEEIRQERGDTMKDKTKEPDMPIVLPNFESEPQRKDVAYIEEKEQETKDPWKITEDSQGWLGEKIDGVPDIYRNVERTLPY